MGLLVVGALRKTAWCGCQGSDARCLVVEDLCREVDYKRGYADALQKLAAAHLANGNEKEAWGPSCRLKGTSEWLDTVTPLSTGPDGKPFISMSFGQLRLVAGPFNFARGDQASAGGQEVLQGH